MKKKIFIALLASLTCLNMVSTIVMADTTTSGYENSSSQLTMDTVGRYISGEVNFDGGVMEIIAFNSNNGYAYAINGQSGLLAVIPMNDINEDYSELQASECDIKSIVQNIDSNFVYGDMTSIDIYGDVLAVALQSEGYNDTGRVAIFNCKEDGSLEFKKIYTVGVQPDMVKFADKDTILTADEGEPREGYPKEGTDVVDPHGTVSIIDLSKEEVTIATFDDFTASELIAKNVLLKKGATPSEDLEPEYITVSNGKAYVSLQEANAIAVVNIENKKIEDVHSVGFVDFSKIGVDLNTDDGICELKTYDNLLGMRMPDGIASYEVNGKTYIVTANEGDGREYKKCLGEEYKNEDKRDHEDEDSPNGNIKAGDLPNKVLYLNTEVVDGVEEGKDYLFGGRSFTILEVNENGLDVVFDSAEEFSTKTFEYLPEYYNVSNDNDKIEDRTGKKAMEPETVKIGEVDGKTYAFIALERTGGIMAYDISDPANSKFVNYINTRDFETIIGNPPMENGEDIDGVCEYDDGELDKYVTGGDVAPEGLAFVSAEESPSGFAMLLASNEVSGTVTAYKLGESKVVTPEVTPEPTVQATEKPETDVPETGDENLVKSWIALGAMLGIGYLGFIVNKFKKAN